MSSFKTAFLLAAALIPASLSAAPAAKVNSALHPSIDGYKSAKFGISTDEFKTTLACSAFLDWTYTETPLAPNEVPNDHISSVKCDSYPFLGIKVPATASFLDDHLTDVSLSNIPETLAPTIFKLLADKYGPSEGPKEVYQYKSLNGNSVIFSKSSDRGYVLLYKDSHKSRSLLNDRLILKKAEKDV